LSRNEEKSAGTCREELEEIEERRDGVLLGTRRLSNLSERKDPDAGASEI